MQVNTYTTAAEMDINKLNISHIDWQLCLKLANNKAELAKEMLSMFVTELPHAYDAIYKAFVNHDVKQFHMQVHRLHGASCYCGVPILKMTLSTLETAIKTADQPKQVVLMQQLDNDIKQLLALYKNNQY